MSIIHIIPHTHWDREWYFSVEDSLVLLSYNMDYILNTLEKNRSFTSFLLDGQVSLIEDYLKIKPENKSRIEKLVRDGRLLIGPWYTQTDEMVVSGESIVRNLLIGTRMSEELGGYMPIGYLPDSFGQSSQMPQIFSGFGIDSVILWRGICDLDTNKTEFLWESTNGSKVFVLQLRFGYGSGQNLKTDELDVKGRIIRIVNELSKLTDTNHIVLPNGGDQVPIQSNLNEIVEFINNIDKDNQYIISNYIDLIRALKESKTNLNILKGEFTKPKYMRIHKSIYSTRYDLKKLNSDAENKLTTLVEPIATIANTLGFEYPKGLIDRAWKLILENQAHDSIGGCNSDSTNADIKSRAKKAHEILDGVLNVILNKMARSVEQTQEGSKLIIFNSLPYKRNIIMECEIITQNKNFSIHKGDKAIEYTLVRQSESKGGLFTYMTSEGEKTGDLPNYYTSIVYINCNELPSLGFDTYYIREELCDLDKLIVVEDNFIENKYYKIYINRDGSITIEDKQNNKVFNKCLIYEDSGNDGDEYNFSPPLKDLCISSENTECEFQISKSRLIQKAYMNTVLRVPKDLDSRKKGIIDGEIIIKTEIGLDEYSDMIRFNIEVNNSVKDHRLRVLFNTRIESEYSYADNQFGMVKRDIKLGDQLDDYCKTSWKEMPINIEPMLSMVELNDGCSGVALLTNGIKEYQIIGRLNDTIALTLLSTTGILGKDNLLWRPGRASGINNETINTPDAQVLGERNFEFALYMHEGGINKSKAPFWAKELNNCNTYYQDQNLSTSKYRLDRFELLDDNIKIPESFSLVEIDKHIILSSIKMSEDTKGYILRVYNPCMAQISNQSMFFSSKVIANEANLAERQIGNEKFGRKFDLEDFKPCEVKTFKVNAGSKT